MDPRPPDRPRPPDWHDPTMWLVVGLPLSAVVAGLLTLWIALHYRDPLVNDPPPAPNATQQEPAPPKPDGTGG